MIYCSIRGAQVAVFRSNTDTYLSFHVIHLSPSFGHVYFPSVSCRTSAMSHLRLSENPPPKKLSLPYNVVSFSYVLPAVLRTPANVIASTEPPYARNPSCQRYILA